MKKPTGRYYDHQNFWQLASIQTVSLGAGVLAIGTELAQKYGTGTAVCSIIAGNFILWLIAISVISMVDRARFNAIDNIGFYIGKYGSMLAACVFVLAFLNWYSTQIHVSTELLARAYTNNISQSHARLIKYGAGLGCVTALLSIGGIRLLRKAASISLLPFVIYFIYAAFVSKVPLELKGSWGISFPATLSVILILLPGVINFPTFFRHSISKSHSIFSLSLITCLISFFEISMIWIDVEYLTKSSYGIVAFSLFVLCSQIFCNFLNIYLASACWEAFVPKFEGRREYAILGLFGTLVFALFQIGSLMQFIENLTASYIAILGVVLLLSYLTRILVHRKTQGLERAMNITALLVGWCVATIYGYKRFPDSTVPVLAGVTASILFSMIVLFIEETFGALKTKLSKKQKRAERNSAA